MARGVNRVFLIGNLTRSVELRFTDNGHAVANFSIACNDREKRNGEWVDTVEYINIVVWGKQAENCENYLSKGSSVWVEGKLKTRKWQDKEGNDRYTTEIVANNIQFLGGGDPKTSSQGQHRGGQYEGQQQNQGGHHQDEPF